MFISMHAEKSLATIQSIPNKNNQQTRNVQELTQPNKGQQ